MKEFKLRFKGFDTYLSSFTITGESNTFSSVRSTIKEDEALVLTESQVMAFGVFMPLERYDLIEIPARRVRY